MNEKPRRVDAEKGGWETMLTSIHAAKELDPPIAVGAVATTTETSVVRRREFEQILSRDLPRFHRMAKRWLRNREDAEDAVQEAMLSAFRHIARFDGRSQMKTWITAIVINAVRMQIRRRPRGQMLSLDHSLEYGQLNVSEKLADLQPAQDQVLIERESLDIIKKLTSGLSVPQKAVLKLRLEKGLSIKDTAETLEVPIGTVKANLTRARAKLARRYFQVTHARTLYGARQGGQKACLVNSAPWAVDQTKFPLGVVSEQAGFSISAGA